MMQTVQDEHCCGIQTPLEDPKVEAERPLMKGQEQNPEGISAILITQREVGTVFKGYTCSENHIQKSM